MNSSLFAVLAIVAATFNIAVEGQNLTCSTYVALGQEGYYCNDRSDIVCNEGCTSFITATNCVLYDQPKKRATTEVCTLGFGRDTAGAKACHTGQGMFRCTGKFGGQATCRRCVKRVEKVKWL